MLSGEESSSVFELDREPTPGSLLGAARSEINQIRSLSPSVGNEVRWEGTAGSRSAGDRGSRGTRPARRRGWEASSTTIGTAGESRDQTAADGGRAARGGNIADDGSESMIGTDSRGERGWLATIPAPHKWQKKLLDYFGDGLVGPSIDRMKETP